MSALDGIPNSFGLAQVLSSLQQQNPQNPQYDPSMLALAGRGPVVGGAPPMPPVLPSHPQGPLQGAPPPQGPQGPPGAPPQNGPQNAQSRIDSDRQMLLSELSGLNQTMGQRYDTYQQGASNLKDLLYGTARYLANYNTAPSDAERYGRIAQAFGSPTRTGSLGEHMGMLGGQMADLAAQQRERELQKNMLVAKYAEDAGQMGLQSAAMGMNQLSSRMNNTQTRLASIDMANARNNNPNQLIIRDSAGQPQINQPAVQARAMVSGAEAAARMHAQMAGVQGGPLQDQMMATAQQMASYKLPMPPMPRYGNPVALQNWYALNSMVRSLNPDYDGTTFPVKQSTIRSFMSGKDGTLMTSLNTAMQHLSLLSGLMDAYNGGDIQAINEVKGRFEKAFGRAAPANIQLVQAVAAEEVNKIAVGGPGAEADRAAMRDLIPGIKSSPEQASEGLDHAINLMAGRTYALRQRWKAGTKLGDADFDAQLTPEARYALETHGGGGSSTADTAAGATKPAGRAPAEKDVAWLRSHPDPATKAAFVKTFGSLPEGME